MIQLRKVGSSYEKGRIIVSTTDQVTTNRHSMITLVLRQAAWHTVLGNTPYVQDISQNFVARTMADPYSAARSSTDWERLASTNFATSSILRSDQTVYDLPVHTSSSKRSVSCEKRRCHLNKTL